MGLAVCNWGSPCARFLCHRAAEAQGPRPSLPASWRHYLPAGLGTVAPTAPNLSFPQLIRARGWGPQVSTCSPSCVSITQSASSLRKHPCPHLITLQPCALLGLLAADSCWAGRQGLMGSHSSWPGSTALLQGTQSGQGWKEGGCRPRKVKSSQHRSAVEHMFRTSCLEDLGLSGPL